MTAGLLENKSVPEVSPHIIIVIQIDKYYRP